MKVSCDVTVTKSSDDGSTQKTTENSFSFEDILHEIGGFGRYQILIGCLMGIFLLMATSAVFNFVFSSEIPDHRCLIPECESPNSINFDAEWTNFAIPQENGRLESCTRFQYIPTSSDGSCSAQNFNQSHMIHCDSFFVKNGEDRLVTRLNTLCTGHEDKMALIATANTFGRLAGMPFSGIISDRYGRLTAIIGYLVFGSLFSCLQVLPASIMSFELYLAFEFMVAVSLTGIYGAVYVFNMEWVSPKYRVYLNSITSLTNSLSPAYLGLIAWYFEESFIQYKLFLAIPGFFAIFLYFILGESPRWLLAHHKYTRATAVISKAAKINGRPLHEKTIEQIQTISMQNPVESTENTPMNAIDEEVTLFNVLKRRILAFRLFVLALIWLFTIFAYYGIILVSKGAHENKYASYIAVGLAEFPGILLMSQMMDRLGRRITIGIPMLTYGFVLIMTIFLSPDQNVIKLILLIVGRAAISTVCSALSTYSTELWPTKIRNTAFNISSMAGRIGSITASLSVFLVKYYIHLPVILYGSVTLVAAVLLFSFMPETMNCEKVPDTIDETIAIGKESRKQTKNCES